MVILKFTTIMGLYSQRDHINRTKRTEFGSFTFSLEEKATLLTTKLIKLCFMSQQVGLNTFPVIY